MILISKKLPVKETAGRRIQFPVIGVAEFDDKGRLEVDDKLAADLIEATVEAFDFVIEAEKKKQDKKTAETNGAIEKLVNEFEEQVKELGEEDLLALVRETGSPAFKGKAIGLTNDQIKGELVKQYRKQLEADAKSKS